MSQKKTNDLPQMVCKKDIARHLGVTTRFIEMQVRSGKMPAPLMIGGTRRWPIEEINEWLTKCPRTKPSR